MSVLNPHKERTWSIIFEIVDELSQAEISFVFTDLTALFIQGIDEDIPASIHLLIQWDQFSLAKEIFSSYPLVQYEGNINGSKITFEKGTHQVMIGCKHNTVVITDPYRVYVEKNGKHIWVKSLEYYLYHEPSNQFNLLIHNYLKTRQEEIKVHNAKAWNEDSYEAWLTRFGVPNDAAKKIMNNPEGRLAPLHRYLGNVNGKNIINLMGSHGSKAVALALLGAQVTVVDLSSDNARYANELASSADVNIEYIVSDILEIPEEVITKEYDIVFMELGILHYFIDLFPLFSVITKLLKKGGKLILHDFHPISTKLITSKGKKHKVTGNYFNQSLYESDVAFSKHFSPESAPENKVLLRKWTLGEIITTIASEGLFITRLDEEPNNKIDDIGIPKTFTIIAEKL